MKSCMMCGVAKDETTGEKYPWPAEDGISEGPLPPFFNVDCDNRRVRVCHSCFHVLSPDMWITQSQWEEASPTIPFEQLETWNPSR